MFAHTLSTLGDAFVGSNGFVLFLDERTEYFDSDLRVEIF
jgi:hypothetical protein